jgi:adenylylsulfate kinase
VIQNHNIRWQHGIVTRAQREQLNGHHGCVVWLTGLSGAGKSTLAHCVEERLVAEGCRAYVLDGDNVRHGLCRDLGFTPEDRCENIRRIGEMGKLMTDAGLIVISAFISPFRSDRDGVRKLLGEGDFIEVYCDAPLDVCEGRDVKGLYQKARSGELSEFTGISSPYEAPLNPEVVVHTGRDGLDVCADKVLNYLRDKNKLLSTR